MPGDKYFNGIVSCWKSSIFASKICLNFNIFSKLSWLWIRTCIKILHDIWGIFGIFTKIQNEVFWVVIKFDCTVWVCTDQPTGGWVLLNRLKQLMLLHIKKPVPNSQKTNIESLLSVFSNWSSTTRFVQQRALWTLINCKIFCHSKCLWNSLSL